MDRQQLSRGTLCSWDRIDKGNSAISCLLNMFLIYNLKYSGDVQSSSINEVIRAILDFFIQKFHEHKKAENAYKRTKIKNALKKHLRGK